NRIRSHLHTHRRRRPDVDAHRRPSRTRRLRRPRQRDRRRTQQLADRRLTTALIPRPGLHASRARSQPHLPERRTPMSETDYASAYDFATNTEPSISYQLRFRPHPFVTGSPWDSNPTGQLVAVIVEYRHPRNGQTIAISRPHVHFNDVEAAVDSDNWPFLK